MKNKYSIAGLVMEVRGEPLVRTLLQMSAFKPFEYQGTDAPFFSVEWSDSASAPFTEKAVWLYESECDGARSAVYALEDDFMVRSWYMSRPESLSLRTEGAHKVCIGGDLSPQILRFTLWLGYGLMAIRHNRIPIHSSAVICDGNAYLFLGESGTGKSTHTRLWREYIPGAELLNDDSPILAAEDGLIWVYGSPWSGKTPCYRQEKYPLKAFVRLSQAPHNSMIKLSPLKAYGAVHPSCPPEFAYHDTLYDFISNTLSQVLAKTAVFHLECLPDRAAAELSYRTLSDR